MTILKRSGTTLASIHQHQIWIQCGCGHSNMVEVSDLLALPRPPITVGDVTARARCARCGAANIKHFRITWRGGSDRAMLGAATGFEKWDWQG